MTILDTFTQQPGETLDYDISYKSTDIPADDTIESASASWVNMDDPDDVDSLNLGLCTFTNTPKRTKTWVGEPPNGKRYKITVTVVTTGGRTLEDEFVIRGKED